MAPEGSITKADEHSRLEFAGRWTRTKPPTHLRSLDCESAKRKVKRFSEAIDDWSRVQYGDGVENLPNLEERDLKKLLSLAQPRLTRKGRGGSHDSPKLKLPT